MAGALLHLAMGDPEKMNSDNPAYTDLYKKAYTLGLLLPDIAKQNLILSAEDYDSLFEGCSQADFLTYEDYLEFSKNNHFNPSLQNPERQDTRNPNLTAFKNAGYVDLQKPVWQGVLCHLMGDKAFYYKSYCVDFDRLKEDYIREVGENEKWDEDRWKNSRTGKVYYEDYNLLNQRFEDEFGTLERVRHYLPAPILERLLNAFAVEFPADGREPVYMKEENIRKYIGCSRVICRDVEDGKIEKALQSFGEGQIDGFFC